jgi:hypothetical protein
VVCVVCVSVSVCVGALVGLGTCVGLIGGSHIQREGFNRCDIQGVQGWGLIGGCRLER